MNHRKLLFFVIILSACLTQFAADIYAPSLPAIALSFGSSVHLAQISMVIYMVGVAVTLLIYGPISDGIGRKTPLVVGLSIMTVGSMICLFAPSIQILILGRFIQGCGAGACSGLWRSIFRDIFTGEQLAKYASYFTIFVMFIVPAAPGLGGYLQQYFGWRANFLFMLFYALFSLFSIIFWFKETSVHHHKDKLRFSYFIATFRQLIGSKIFMGITLCTFLSYGAFFSWLMVGPILLIHIIGITPLQYGLITCIGGGFSYGLAGWINGKVVTRFGASNLMRFGWSIMILASIFMLLANWFVGINIWGIVIPMLLFYFGSTFIWPNAFATAFSPFGHIAGYAGALYGFMQIGGGAVINIVITYLPHHNQIPLALVMGGASVLAWLIYEAIHVRKNCD